MRKYLQRHLAPRIRMGQSLAGHRRGPFSYSRITTDDRHGVIRSYVGDGQFVDDPLDTFGSRAVVEVEDLQGLMRYVCRQGFEHHAAMNQWRAAAVLHEAFSNYFGWETSDNQIPCN